MKYDYQKYLLRDLFLQLTLLQLGLRTTRDRQQLNVGHVHTCRSDTMCVPT